MGYLYIFGTIVFTVYGQMMLKWRLTALNFALPAPPKFEQKEDFKVTFWRNDEEVVEEKVTEEREQVNTQVEYASQHASQQLNLCRSRRSEQARFTKRTEIVQCGKFPTQLFTTRFKTRIY